MSDWDQKWDASDVIGIEKAAEKRATIQERNLWLSNIDEMLKVVEDNLVYGPLTEHELGWKNALLSLKARRMEPPDDNKPKCNTCKGIGHVNYESCPDCS